MAMSVLDRKGDFTDKERALSSIAPLRNVDRHIALPPNRTSDLSLIVTDPTQSLDQKKRSYQVVREEGSARRATHTSFFCTSHRVLAAPVVIVVLVMSADGPVMLQSKNSYAEASAMAASAKARLS